MGASGQVQQKGKLYSQVQGDEGSPCPRTVEKMVAQPHHLL